jgi:hypothetical protein
MERVRWNARADAVENPKCGVPGKIHCHAFELEPIENSIWCVSSSRSSLFKGISKNTLMSPNRGNGRHPASVF